MMRMKRTRPNLQTKEVMKRNMTKKAKKKTVMMMRRLERNDPGQKMARPVSSDSFWVVLSCEFMRLTEENRSCKEAEDQGERRRR
jgi:hypothetical protein